MDRDPVEPPPGARPDLRLVPAALATWAAQLAGLLGGPAGGIAAALLSAAAVLTGLIRSRLTGRPTPSRYALVAAGGCAFAAAVLITVHATGLHANPLRVAAERGAAAEVRVVLTDDPRPLRHPGFGSDPGGASRMLVPARLVSATAGEGRWSLGGDILLLTPAEGWDRLLPGQEVSAQGLLAPAQRPDLTVAVLRVRGSPEAVAPAPWWQTGAGTLRDGLRDAAARALPTAPAGLLPGLAVGDVRNQTPEVEQDFRAAGLTHLTAVSGSNLAIVAGAVLLLLRLFRADPRLAAVLAALAIVGFVVLARPSPSVLRAAVMGGVVLLALALGRARSAVPALSAAVLILLLVDPTLALDAGFGLSVLATGALVLFAPGWAARLRGRGVPPGAAEALVVPAAAALATAPLIAGLSGQVSLVSVAANLLVVPAVAPATVLGVLGAVVSPLSPDAAQACAWLAGPAVRWLVFVADRAAAVPGGVLPWPDGLGGALLLTGVLLLLLALGRRPRIRALLLAILLGLLLVLIPTRVVPPGWPPAGWSVVACDVGQGDALVLATGTPGWVVVVDTGPQDGATDACLDRLGVQGIALLVVSHLHADHIGGVDGALRDRPTSAVAVGPVREPRGGLQKVASAASSAGAPLVGLSAGRSLSWPALRIDVLGPLHPSEYVDPDDGTAVNDGSLVLRAQTPAGSVLLTGDVELSSQGDLLAAGVPLQADVLKMPHHGSRYSSVPFLNAVRPRAALVSVGAGNTYRHPNPEMIEALTRAGVVVARTDLSGDVAVTAAEDADGDGRPELALVARGDPQPAPRRSGGRRPGRPTGPLSPGGTGPRGRPCWSTARSRSGRPRRRRRRAS
ncbi:DNA internalization-related competence protein ComEC/Rec2 [Pseudonocardia sp. KRD291]|uniref:DNA internalization-related competence protein ComEC/Rec2 n=1 Tax=Pseudonocardia sp. KRD291 TaxID=2792007 RepID=UPI001C4A1B93|nr:DNA internalization-related competence protein ComEC/Rec2 [Pseudonocardia sp. KRD291]